MMKASDDFELENGLESSSSSSFFKKEEVKMSIDIFLERLELNPNNIDLHKKLKMWFERNVRGYKENPTEKKYHKLKYVHDELMRMHDQILKYKDGKETEASRLFKDIIVQIESLGIVQDPLEQKILDDSVCVIN